ncbi:unnamed protein product [Phytomonas sp. EM1]|nr:unnamed protein product [Phytomonas sp. EM1]|eukprot:CCW59610.1 unnamed protein product [Phytomonas sp. isolate EM1]
MFRVSSFFKAAFVSFKPALASSISEEAKTRRAIGIRTNRPVNVQIVNSIVEKTNGEGLAGIAATIARAGLYLNPRNPTSAMEEIHNVLPKIQDEPLKQMAIGIVLRAWNDLLDDKEAALSVSGAATEAEVSEIRTKTLESYNAFKTAFPDCWLVRLACAEFNMYLGKNEDAYNEFIQIEKDIKKAIDTPSKLVNEVATDKNTNPFLLLGHQLLRNSTLQNLKSKTEGKSIQEEISGLSRDSSNVPGLDALKKELGGNLSDEEVIEIAFILYNANLRHHFHDFFPLRSEYEDWDSAKAQRAKKLILNAYQGVCTGDLDEVLDKVRSSAPKETFYAPLHKLQEVLKTSQRDKSVVKSIRAALADGSDVHLSKDGETCRDAINIINSVGMSPEASGTIRYAQQQAEILKILNQQLLYRTKVQIAVVLSEMNRLHEAVQVVTPVIDADEYIYMWRALLTRSRAHKGLGLITLSDKDAKVLNKLKRSLVARPLYEVAKQEC